MRVRLKHYSFVLFLLRLERFTLLLSYSAHPQLIQPLADVL